MGYDGGRAFSFSISKHFLVIQSHGIGEVAMRDIKSKACASEGEANDEAAAAGKALVRQGFGVDVIEQVQSEMAALDKEAEAQVSCGVHILCLTVLFDFLMANVSERKKRQLNNVYSILKH